MNDTAQEQEKRVPVGGGWCCAELASRIGLTIDTEDIRELGMKRCPWCRTPFVEVGVVSSALFPELERRRNEAWHVWQRLVTTYPNDQIAINRAHEFATGADREWEAAYSGNDPSSATADAGSNL